MSSPTQIIPLVTSSIPFATPQAALDCGCGIGKWCAIVRCHRKEMKNAYVVGLDIFAPNLKYCKKYGAYDDLILADARKLPFRNDSFELVLACEIIEHMKREDGEGFLGELERTCSGRTIITTPNIYIHNPVEYENHLVNEWEHHHSKWGVKDFRKRGYVVRGIGIRLAVAHKSFGNIMGAFDFLLFPAWFLPQVAKFLCAYKDKTTNSRLTC